MTEGSKKWLRRCILITEGLVTLLLWETAYMVWSSLAQDFDTVSVRFEEEANYQQVQKTLSIKQGLRPTFWREGKDENLTVEKQARPKTADVFHFYGDGEDVLPARFLSGDYPPTAVDGGCVVSSSLSKELWGTQDAIGKKLWSGKREYQVYGIFDSPEKLMMVQQYPRANVEFSAMEMESPLEQGGQRAAMDFVKHNGLPPAQTVINGPGFCWLFYQLVLMPFYVLLVMSLWRVRKTEWPKWGKISLFVAGALLFLWLFGFPYQALFQKVGQNWTDAAFWQELLRGLQVNFRELFTLPPTYRDALLSRQTAYLVLSAMLASVGMVFLVKGVVYRYCLPFSRKQKGRPIQYNTNRHAGLAMEKEQ